MGRKPLNDLEQRARQISKSSKPKLGRDEYINYLTGKKVSMQEAIFAHCWDCSGDGGDDAESIYTCDMKICPLYPFFPYRSRLF